MGNIASSSMANSLTATLFSRVLDWFHHGSFKQWVTLDFDLSPILLTSLPWLLPNDRPLLTQVTPLLSSFLYVWDRVIKTYKISSCPGPLTPILSNPGFPPGMSDKSFICRHPSHIWYSFTDRGLKPLGKLSSPSNSKGGEWLQYFQLPHFYEELSREGLCRDMTQFEELCLSDSKCPHTP